MSEENKVEKPEVKEKATGKKVAVIRIRGIINLSGKIKTTFEMLRLKKKNSCSVLDVTPSVMGMINKVKDFVTWGEIDDETYKELVSKRGTEFKGRTEDKNKKIIYNKGIKVGEKLLKPVFTLAPPRKGYGRKGIKYPFNKSGALGDRKEKINDLIKRML